MSSVSNAPPVYESVDDIPARFGEFGGRFIPETLVAAHEELERAYVAATQDPEFRRELEMLGRDFIGRPTPMYFAKRLTEKCGGAEIWFKREDLAHTGSHKINNALGQALLAKKLGKQRVIAETGAGQHGVATATACALLGLECVVYMGEEKGNGGLWATIAGLWQDMRRQALNVFRIRMLGGDVRGVSSGSRTLKDAVNEALRDWVTNVRTTHYIIGSAIGPHPFPTMVRDFQTVIGREARQQFLDRTGGHLPDVVVAVVGGGSNAIGMFHPFIGDADVRLIGVEGGGTGPAAGHHAATLSCGRGGVLHGTRTFLLQSEEGQIQETHSISAGLDYPAVGPEHAHLQASGRAEYVSVQDEDALSALVELSRTEGLIPALEPAHAVFHAIQVAKSLPKDKRVLVNLCGRGDKDMETVAARFDAEALEKTDAVGGQ